MIHKPVLLKEAINNLKLKEGMIVVDATLGGGNYSREILKKIGKKGKLIAIDKDEKSVNNFQKFINRKNLKNVYLFQGSYVELNKFLKKIKVKKINAVVADLGLSTDQLEDKRRGFSFQKKQALLDMRMDQTQGMTAKQIVNQYSEKRLAEIFWKYGNEKFSRSIAKAIVNQRRAYPLETVEDLLQVIQSAIPVKFQHQKIHWATKVFQALRIEVNQELKELKEFLQISIDSLLKKGRLVVVSFHSGEDKIVKGIFRENARGCICPKEFPVCRCGHKAKIKIITRHPVIPSEQEVKKNPRARSAKLRVVEKI